MQNDGLGERILYIEIGDYAYVTVVQEIGLQRGNELVMLSGSVGINNTGAENAVGVGVQDHL